MSDSLVTLIGARLYKLVLPQAVRLAELAARRDRSAERPEVGGDLRLSDEPAHLVAADRMALASGDVAAIEARDGQVRITANIMGLVGTTPALPYFYSELQLQRRRLRDRSMAAFLNIFDHRALSFFYRAFRKHNVLVSFEREIEPGQDAVSRSLLALAGFMPGSEASRLSFDQIALAPLAHHLGGTRRTAAGLVTILRHVTGVDLDVIEATPVWMTLPADAQSRLGAQSSRLGGTDPETKLGYVDGAVLGSTMIDIQHHFTISVGPLRHDELLRFCAEDGPSTAIAEICLFYAGIAYRPAIRVRIHGRDIPPLRLAAPEAPAWLGRTTWLGDAGDGIRDDCQISISARVAGL